MALDRYTLYIKTNKNDIAEALKNETISPSQFSWLLICSLETIRDGQTVTTTKTIADQDLYDIYLEAIKTNVQKAIVLTVFIMNNYYNYSRTAASNFVCNEILDELKDATSADKDKKIRQLLLCIQHTPKKNYLSSEVYKKVAEISPDHLLHFSASPPVMAIGIAKITLKQEQSSKTYIRLQQSEIKAGDTEKLSSIKRILAKVANAYLGQYGQQTFGWHKNCKAKSKNLVDSIGNIKTLADVKETIAANITETGFRPNSLNTLLLKAIIENEELSFITEGKSLSADNYSTENKVERTLIALDLLVKPQQVSQRSYSHRFGH